MTKKILIPGLAVFLSLNVAAAAVNYEELGDQWMDVMMGERHEEAESLIEQQMGEDFLRQMHENMGKMVASNQSGYSMMNMMSGSWGYGSNQMMGWTSGWGSVFGIFFFVFWIGLLALIILGVVRLWQLITRDKNKKK